MEKILLFIPAYNCEKQIGRVLQKFDQIILDWINEIIVINNRSTDHTEDCVIAYQKTHPEIPLKLLRNHENYGLGGSHKVAFQYAIDNGFDYLIVLHGDDQGNIKDVLPVLSQGLHRQYECCLGARFMPSSKLVGYSKFRTFGNRVYNQIFSNCTHRKLYDLGAGINLYSVALLKKKYYMKFKDNLMFNYYMTLADGYYKHNTMFFPLVWSEDDQISNVKMTKQAVDVLKMLRAFCKRPDAFMQEEHREKIHMYYGFDIIGAGE